MALIYEHWRPDTNECFYVGASRDAEETRPYYYGPHNDDYDAVVFHLKTFGLAPFTKIVWAGLERDCVDAYEKIRIAYRRSLLGKKLTNRANGGQGFNINWTEEMRASQSAKASYINNLPENIEKNRQTQRIAQNRPEVVAKKSEAAKIIMNLPEVREKVSFGVRKSNENPVLREARGKRISEGHAKTPFEERSRIAKERQQNIPAEERSEIARKRIASKTPEQLSASAKKAWETRRRKKAEALAAKEQSNAHG